MYSHLIVAALTGSPQEKCEKKSTRQRRGDGGEMAARRLDGDELDGATCCALGEMKLELARRQHGDLADVPLDLLAK